MPALPTTKLSRPSSLQRKSTLKRSVDETDTMEPPSSPSKRARVTFDSDIEIVSADEEDNVDPILIKEQVRRALERQKTGDSTGLERIRTLFATAPDAPNPPSAKTLRAHLQALLANVSSISKDCSPLVSAVLKSEWVGRDEAYYALFVRFLSNLAAAKRGFQSKVMQTLIDLLGPQKTRRIPDCKVVRQRTIHKRILEAIRHIAVNVPTATGALALCISTRLQFEFDKADDRMTFIRSFMKLAEYIPELKSDVLSCIMRELIKLDVSIQDSLDDEEDTEEELLQHMSSSQTLLYQSSQTRAGSSSEEDNDVVTSDESDIEDDLLDKSPDEIRRQQLRDNVKQVDMIMDILFAHYDKIQQTASSEVRHHTIEQITTQFFNHILPTYGARHPQFLVFHFAQTDEITVDSFVYSCIEILRSSKHNPVIRHAAAAYFSGFIGRGARVSKNVVIDCVAILCASLNELRAKYTPQCTQPDVKKFGDFYATFQAILYIFCFRWRYLEESDKESADEFADEDEHDSSTRRFPEFLTEALNQAIFSPLNPLRVCTPVIVEQFAKLAGAFQMFFLYSKIEENKHLPVGGRSRTIQDFGLSQPDRDQSWVGDNGMLEGYFPFDPYHLPISRHWLNDDYVEWEGIPGEYEEQDSSDDEGMELIEEADITDDEQ
jgi:RNA polymerase I-specific transcription initiation factor RRN3